MARRSKNARRVATLTGLTAGNAAGTPMLSKTKLKVNNEPVRPSATCLEKFPAPIRPVVIARWLGTFTVV